jgi:tryptophanyl-tRNA synthetase
VCPVYEYHKVYSTADEIATVAEGCRTAGIGCVDCKNVLIKHVLARLQPMYEKRIALENDMDRVREWIQAGIAKARDEALRTMMEVRAAVGLNGTE